MPKVLISDSMDPKAAEIFRAKGVEVDERPGLTKDELKAIIGDYDGLAIRSATKVTEDLLGSAARLKVIDSWRPLPGLDPDLPEKLLPEGWPRIEARAVFVALYDGLGPLAELRFRQVVAAHDADLAELARYRSTADWAALQPVDDPERLDDHP